MATITISISIDDSSVRDDFSSKLANQNINNFVEFMGGVENLQEATTDDRIKFLEDQFSKQLAEIYANLIIEREILLFKNSKSGQPAPLSFTDRKKAKL